MCGVATAWAQDAAPATPAPSQAPASSSGTSSSTQNPNEVGRRFNIGGTLSFLAFKMIDGSSSTINNSSTVVTTASSTDQSHRLGYGITGQVRLTDRFWFDVSAIYRRIGYQTNSSVATTTTSILNGITTSTVSTTQSLESTKAHLFDIPFLVRFYSSARRPNGPRFFLEGGGAWRISSGIKTSIDNVDATGTETCCTNTPATPAHRSTIGAVGGAGIQLIDPLGIHVTPEVRYTRWMNPIFHSPTVNTDENQLEATISLTF
jgi:hypothetical protein